MNVDVDKMYGRIVSLANVLCDLTTDLDCDSLARQKPEFWECYEVAKIIEECFKAIAEGEEKKQCSGI